MRSKEIITLAYVVLLALVATLFLTTAMIQENWRIEIRLGLAGMAFFIYAVVIVALAMWIQWAWSLIEEKRAETAANTPQVHLVRELAKCNPEQLAVLGKFQQVVQLAGGDADITPIPAWPLMGGGWTTKAFIERLIGLGNANYLPAIRDLEERDVEQAKEVIADFVTRGWVMPARGNQPARWLNRPAAEQQIFGGEG